MSDSPAARLEVALRNHDWYFDWSDDHSAWLKGTAQRTELHALAKMLPESEARQIWARWAPEGFLFPGTSIGIQKEQTA